MCPIICEWGKELSSRETGRALEGNSIYKGWGLAKPFSAQQTIQTCWVPGMWVLKWPWSGTHKLYGVMLAWGKFLIGGNYASETTFMSLLRGRQGQRSSPRREGDGDGEVASVSQWCHSSTLWGVWVREVLRTAAAWHLRATGFVLSMASRCWGKLWRKAKQEV